MSGYEIRSKGINVPLEAMVMLPKDEAGITMEVTIGFNFDIRRFFFSAKD